MLNLIVNAAHAITEGTDKGEGQGEIRIATQRDGDWVEVLVSDNGKGIPAAIRNRIFDPFFTTKEVGKGSGQGSAIVDKHGDTLGVASGEGKGTTFSVRLSITQASAA